MTRPDDRTLVVGRVPYRKSIALSELNGGVQTVLAWFRNEQSAEQFLDIVRTTRVLKHEVWEEHDV